VDRLDSGALLADCSPPFDAARCSTYEQLHNAVSGALFKAHVQGQLKAEVMQDPAKFITRDPDYTQTLLDQRAAGKKLALITNSDATYTRCLMSFCFDSFLPDGMVWTDLFDLVVVSACKPEFFSDTRRPVYEVIRDPALREGTGLLREGFRFEQGKAFAGGTARLVEKCFGVDGSSILYVGDHIFTDVHLAKRGFSWRTALILQARGAHQTPHSHRPTPLVYPESPAYPMTYLDLPMALWMHDAQELEEEMVGLTEGKPLADELRALRRRKDLHASYLAHLEMLMLREEAAGGKDTAGGGELWAAAGELRLRLAEADAAIVRLQAAEGQHVNRFWGYPSRAGFAEKSHLMRQIEK
jgi:hypothetical protein